MVNRLELFNEYKDSLNTIYLDVGNFFPYFRDSLLDFYTKKVHKLFSYDAIAYGTNDINIAENFDNFISLNSDHAKPFKIFIYSNKKIIVTSVFKRFWAIGNKNSIFKKIEDSEIKQTLNNLKKECDFLIVMSDIDDYEQEKFFLDNPSIDLLITTEESEASFINFENRGFASVGNNGEKIGYLTIDFSSDKIQLKNKFIDLFEDLYPPDSTAKELVKNYYFDKSVEEQFKRLNDNRFDYYEESFCQNCHEKVEITHSNSLKTLKSDDKRDECLICHTTGFGTKTGFKLSQTSQSTLSYINCSQCHKIPSGTNFDGNLHTVNPITPSVCTECHIKPHVKDFEFYKSKKSLMKFHK
ncbi:MAG: hypothetical protein JXR48_06840 [Candidatus Delongbacteria bacterium]|nr:hypothetical protein [Candidatus Delongbacteria bacterium]MBN2834667.1 hypothetical protein [Candidatus Delongbacteria bacterium]